MRQLIETGGFYLLEHTQRGLLRKMINLQFIGAMNHPGGGRNDIPNRLKRQFFIFNMTLPTSIEVIYRTIIRHVFKDEYFSVQASRVVDQLASATVSLWNKVKVSMLPTQGKFHYIFNMRELSRIVAGILTCSRKTINDALMSNRIRPELFLVGLWRHECERVFADKLVSSEDKEIVVKLIHETSLESFA